MELDIYNGSHIRETFGGRGDGGRCSSSSKQQIMLLTSCLCYLLQLHIFVTNMFEYKSAM
jgi:hypothetical protein